MSVVEQVRKEFKARDIAADDSLLQQCQEFLNMSTLEISEFVSEIETFLLKENSEELTQGILDRVTSKKRASTGGIPSGVRRKVEMPLSPNMKIEAKSESDYHSPPTGKTPETPKFPTVRKSMSPLGVPYAERKNAGTIFQQFGKISALETKEEVSDEPSFTPNPPHASNITSAYRWMYSPLHERAFALEKELVAAEDAMVKAYKLGTLSPVNVGSQSAVAVVGRICTEEEGKLTNGSLMLEGSARRSNGARVHLDLSEVPEAVVFPGQIVAVVGVNATGRKLVASRVYQGIASVPSSFPARDLREISNLRLAAPDGSGGKNLRIWSACGPFTTTEDLSFQPLVDLLNEAIQAAHPPDVLVLMGPFLWDKHPMYEAGTLKVADANGEIFTMTPETLWRVKILGTMEKMLSGIATQVVLVPSLDDVLAEPVYPQPPLAMPQDFKNEKIISVSNPATFSVGDILIGVNTADILMHLMKTRLVKRKPGQPPESFHSGVGSLIEQQSYYPMFPADPSVPLEVTKRANLRMPVVPDVMLLPSQLQPFVKDMPLDSRGHASFLMVNPGFLTRFNSGGSFARMVIGPIEPKHIKLVAAQQTGAPEAVTVDGESSGTDAMSVHSVAKRSLVDLIKI